MNTLNAISSSSSAAAAAAAAQLSSEEAATAQKTHTLALSHFASSPIRKFTQEVTYQGDRYQCTLNLPLETLQFVNGALNDHLKAQMQAFLTQFEKSQTALLPSTKNKPFTIHLDPENFRIEVENGPAAEKNEPTKAAVKTFLEFIRPYILHSNVIPEMTAAPAKKYSKPPETTQTRHAAPRKSRRAKVEPASHPKSPTATHAPRGKPFEGDFSVEITVD
jgi:hypothetical protein